MRTPLVAAFFIVALHAQEEGAETYGHSRHGTTFDEGPRSAAYLMPGMSAAVHFPVEGISELAQKFFDQGVTQQHGFWHFEAERSFRQVAKLHPDCAMAYWGMCRANDDVAERAAGFIANAVARSKDCNAREQLWIDAWARFYRVGDKDREELQSGDKARAAAAVQAVVDKNKERAGKELNKLHKQLLKDLGTIVFEHPDDVEAKAFLAIQNWLAYRWGGGIPITSHTAVNALLDQVFEAQPLHPAHHYRIHLWDREDARRALGSAAKNGSSAPAIAHQWHMPGHIYAKLHRHDEAAWQQEASGRADHAHMMRDGVMPFLIHNYAHNQEWLARSLGHCGRVEDALQIAKNLVELPRHPKHNQIKDGGSAAGYGRKRLIQLCEDHSLWDEALTLVEQGYLEQSDDLKSEVARLRLLGRACYRLGRRDDAARVVAEVGGLLAKARAQRASAIDEAEQRAFDERLKRDKMLAAVEDAGEEPTSVVQSVLNLQRELKAEQLMSDGDAVAALKELEGVHVSASLRGGVQIAAGKVDEALKALEKDNERNPNRVATLAQLARARQAKLAAAGEGGEKEAAESALRDAVAALAERAPSEYVQRAVGARPTPRAAVGFGEDFGPRPELDSIGPRVWSPVSNPGVSLPAIAGAPYVLTGDGDGARATLVVFYLGFGCLHCVEQLHALRPLAKEFAAAGVDIVAVGSDSVAGTKQAFMDLPAAERMPFPMLCDPKMQAFRAWRCFDDFEGMPLHGTFLVDRSGRVRWQDISYEPFMELEWLLREGRRLLALPAPAGVR
ncbi:MAG: redoxin domain-containing protein [Planctomycetota bacterium]|nr:redoxin domain-containing protein [Planctomycetota bacterium]MEC9047232.1 redoxin domain-containing protein [Planctomycetota bacterium]